MVGMVGGIFIGIKIRMKHIRVRGVFIRKITQEIVVFN